MVKVLTTATLLALFAFAPSPFVFVLDAGELTEAQVTRIIREVQVLPEYAAPRPAALQDIVRGGTAVRTGIESRTELTFSDQTLARLGANTLFTFNGGTRSLDLGGGAMLLHVPKSAGGAKILTAAVTAAITGTTVLIEYHPPEGARDGKDFSKSAGSGKNVVFGLVTRDPAPGDLSSNYIKFITLEGVARIYVKDQPGRPILVPAGKMLVIAPDGSWYNVLEVNLKVLVDTSPLITDFPPLPSLPQIVDEIERQHEEEISGGLIDTDLVNYAGGQPVSLRDPQPLDTIDQRFSGPGIPAATPTATPSKFGTPPVITAPNPYIVGPGTTINTDPAITNNGISRFGKIYRGMAIDGPFSTWAFGSSSDFDMAAGIDNAFSGGATVPLAAFKFTALELMGDPVIDTTGGAINLALVSVGNLTDVAPGGTLTFGGINTLLLATQNGAINFSPSISFSNLNQLMFYARGAGSNLTLACAVNGVQTVDLNAEGSILVNGAQAVNTFNAFAGVDFRQGTGQISAPNVSIRAGNDLNLALSRFAVAPGLTTSVSLQAGANVNIDANSNQSLLTNASLLTINAAGGINIAGLSISGGPLTLQFGNSAVVAFTAGAGGITAPTINLIDSSFGLSLTSAGDIIFNSISGADTVQSTGGDVSTNLDLIANTVAAGGSVTADGDLTASSSIMAGGPIAVTGTLLSPSATAGANITAGHIELRNVTTPANLIGGSGGITPFVSASGASLLHTFSVATVVSPNGIDFSGNNFSAGSPGGMLQIDATSLVFGAGGIGSANFNGGAFGGDGGTLTVNASGNISLSSTTISATTGTPNSDTPEGAGGTVNLTSTNGQVSINNSTIRVSSNSSARGGKINLRSNVATGVAINVTNSAQLLALLAPAAPGPGGLITVMATGANSSVNVSGRMQATIGGGVDIRHSGDAGTINLGNPTIQADVIKVAALGTNGVLNITGGNFNAGLTLKLYAPGSNGQINFLANCTLRGGDFNIIAANSVTIANNVIVTIASPTQAMVFTNHPNYTGFGGNGTTTGTFGGPIGAATPQPLSAAPPLGPPGVP
jgi:hypothetical protein